MASITFTINLCLLYLPTALKQFRHGTFRFQNLCYVRIFFKRGLLHCICNHFRYIQICDFGLSGEVDVFESLVKISEITELVEREKKLDALRWNWMEDAIFFDYFTVERIFAFLLKLEMIERWISLDKERGNQLFRSIIESLKNDVQIPAEFR